MKFISGKAIFQTHFPRRLRNGLISLRASLRDYSGSSKYNSGRPNASPNLVKRWVPANSKTWMDFAVVWFLYSMETSRMLSLCLPTTLLVVAGVAVFIYYNDERRAIPKGSHHGGENERTRASGPVFGGPFRLIDSQHRVVTESDLLGNWTLLYFGYTSSPDIGPQEVQKMANAVDSLESHHELKIKPVFISIDPQRDSPSQLQAYLQEFSPRIVGLTGTIESVRQTALEYRVYFKKEEEEGEDYLVATSHNMYLLDPKLEIVKCFTVRYDAEQLAEAILNEVRRVASRSDRR